MYILLMTVLVILGASWIYSMAETKPKGEGEPGVTGESSAKYVADSTTRGCGYFIPLFIIAAIILYLGFIVVPPLMGLPQS